MPPQQRVLAGAGSDVGMLDEESLGQGWLGNDRYRPGFGLLGLADELDWLRTLSSTLKRTINNIVMTMIRMLIYE